MTNFQVQIASMCMCINISASVALGCLFTPKVYLVLFQPYKNVRPGHANVSNTNFIIIKQCSNITFIDCQVLLVIHHIKSPILIQCTSVR